MHKTVHFKELEETVKMVLKSFNTNSITQLEQLQK